MNPPDNTRVPHRRRSIRVPGYDYRQPGAYFVTVCTYDRTCLFGNVADGQMRLNDAGQVAQRCWLDIPNHFPNVVVDAFVVMPNHIHGIIVITVGANDYSPLPGTSTFQSPSKTIGSIVRGFKIGVTKWFRQHRNIGCVWQRNYYEHVVRDEGSLNRIREYIAANPQQWAIDRENPEARPAERIAAWEV